MASSPWASRRISAMPSEEVCCTKCGQTLPPEGEPGINLAPIQRRIFDLVRRAGPHGISSTRLFNLIYDCDSNGGPLNGKRCLYVHVNQTNKRLRKHGLRMHGGSGAAGCRYRIENIQP